MKSVAWSANGWDGNLWPFPLTNPMSMTSVPSATNVLYMIGAAIVIKLESILSNIAVFRLKTVAMNCHDPPCIRTRTARNIGPLAWLRFVSQFILANFSWSVQSTIDENIEQLLCFSGSKSEWGELEQNLNLLTDCYAIGIFLAAAKEQKLPQIDLHCSCRRQC